MIQKTDLGIKWGRYGMIAFLCAYVLVVLLVGGMSASATVEGEERGPRPVVKLDKEEVVTASLWGDDFGYEVEYIGESVYTSAGVDFGDWDGDGDLDLAVANSDGPVQVYENVEGTFLLDTANGLGWVAPITRDTVSVDWGDWDGDGDLDLALGNNRETSQVYENVDGEYLVLAWTASVVQPTSAVAWGDWDGDGDLDLAFGNEAFLGSMRNYVYENVGGNLVQAWESPDNTRTSDIAWGDYDGDGDLDLAAVNLATQANVVYENTGGNLALNVAGGLGWVQPSGKQVSFAVEWGDVDGDGDLDLAFGNDGADQIYFNEGGELTLGWSASSTDQSYGLAFADWDGDGDLDLAAGAYLGDQSNRIYENDGTGNMLLDPVNGWGWQEDNTVSTFDLVWADADNDGDIDLVLATSARTRIYVNNSGLLLPAEGQRMETDSFSVDWGDYDGDGDLDLAMASHAFSEVVAYENVDNQLLRLPSQGVGWSKPVSGTVTRMMAVAWGDVDGDGDLDLAAGTDGGLDLVYENDNGTFRLDPSGGWGWTSEVMSNTQDVAWGDYDGDGDLDLAMALYGDRNRIYENVGGVLSFDLAAGIGWEAPLKQWTRRIDWGDWDGDGDLDLAVANENNANRVYENVGGDLELAWEAPDVYNSIDIEWGDYDGDGDLDLAVANEDELTHIWENVGKELRLDEANGFGWSSPRENDGRLAWGDYDGDGDLDLFVSATYYYNLSSSYIYENVGDGFVGHSFPIVANDAVWGDYDGDGDLDLGLAPLFNNEMFVYENNLYTNDKMVANLPQVVMDYPGAGAESVSGGVSGILTDNVIPITYTVSDPEGDVMGRVGLFYSLNGGGEWLPAVAAAGTLTTNVPSAAFPVATADTYTIAQNYTLTLPAPGLLANDTASEAVLATPPLSGTLAMDIKGGFVYTPALGFTGIETFTYSARNGIYEAAPTTVAVNVVPNTAPIAQTDVYTTYQVVPLYMDVVANDTDGEMNGLTPMVVTPPVTGTLVVTGTNQLLYTPVMTGPAVVTFTYQAYDGALSSAPTMVTINVETASPVDLLACNMPAVTFEAGLPSEWVSVVNTGLFTWTTTADTACAWGNETPGTGEAACADADQFNEARLPYDLDLMTNPFNLPGEGNATLRFGYYLETYEIGSILDADILVDGSWHNVWWITGYYQSNGEAEIDLSPYLGESDLQLRFKYSGEDWDYAAMVDDVSLDCQLTATNTVNDEAQLTKAISTTHVFYWDTFASGFFGQSDDVLVRLELYEQDNTKPVTGTYSYPNLAPAETLHPYATTTSSPFRVRGTQIRVFGDGPDAAWPLDEITGTVAIEANGSGYDGSLLTGTTFTTDTAPVNYPNASAVAFNGIDEPLFVPSIPIVNRTVTPERAISVWFKADDVTINDRKQVIFEAGGAVNGLSIYLYDGELYAGAYMESGGVSGWGGDWVTTTQVESGQWHHLVWQMFGDDLVQADRMSLYLDGELVGTAPGMQTYNHPNANSLGGINGDTKFHDVGDVTGPGPLAHLFVGVIDELRVYNRLLTPAEIRQLAEGEPLYSVTAPVANARIYRLPAGQTTNGTLLTDSAGLPLVSDNQGYLQGQAQLAVGDQLMAMVPITVTDAYTLYYTSGTPITTGLDLDNVNNPGTQNLTVSSAKPLLLFNLDVSLEWDATNDDLFLDTLATVLGYSSDVLYDVSNGQAALGDVRLYQNRENWHEADILLYAANDIHPSATMGGVVDDPVHDIGLTGVITNAYRPGLIRMGSNWDPFGEGQADFTQEWWQALTHELGHYLFFMPDNYIGADEGGILATDCIGSFMTTSYDDAYSEFLPEADWIGDCLLTLAAQTTGRPDWETITTFYPMLNAPASRFENSGPTVLPLAMTAVTMVPPAMDNGIQAGGNYTLRAADTGQVVTVPQARGYLRQTRGTADLSDDGIIPLGVTNAGGDRLKVRGAAVGDEVCIVDTSRNPAYLGCETVDSLSSSIDVYTVAGWQPNILVKSITSETLAITVTQYVSSAMMNVQVLPAYGLPGRADLITSTWGALTVVDPLNPVTFTGQIDLDYLTFEGTVRVWVPGTVPTQQAFTDFAISLDAWGGESAIWGGESAIWGGESAIWGGPSRPWGAPSVSTDGQLVILNFDDPYGPTGIGSMQSLASVPTLPAWLTVVGDAYNVQLRPGFTANVTRTIAIDYLQRQTPDGYEHTLTMYYSPDYGKTWLRLPTRLDTEENRAVAFMDNNQPEGLYALIATVRMSPFTLGWNLFGYPINETRPITSALASIDGSYNSVYHYDAYTGQWLLYDAVVAKNYADYAGLVNTLDNLEYGLGYWLYATEPITLFLGVPTDNGNSLTEPVNGLFAFPPMTIFGPVWSTAEFVPTAGMTIEAYVNDVLCGTGTLVEWQGALAYQLQVKANSGDGCGLTGATVHFAIDGQMLWGGEAVWDSSQAQYHPLTAAVCVAPSTPMVAGEVVGLDILLSWADVGASGYEVWVQDGPYAAAGADCATAANCELVSGLGYVDEGGVVVGEARWYQVGAVASCGVRGDVAEVGVMTIEIVGGE